LDAAFWQALAVAIVASGHVFLLARIAAAYVGQAPCQFQQSPSMTQRSLMKSNRLML
jgi:hypothetical protein